jgi:hypothetical protein
LRVSSQPVVVALVTLRLPEMSALPWTAKAVPGLVVATPTLEAKVLETVVEVATM